MSFETLSRERQITIVRNYSDSDTAYGEEPYSDAPWDGDNEDEYGNQVKVPVDTETVWARRKQLSADEDVSDRDEQARTFTYFVKPSVVCTGRDSIRDGDLLLKVVGEPELINNNLRPHHLEIRATLVDA